MRRIVSVLAAAALMAAMMVASALPAFAFEPKPTKSQGNCVGVLESSFTKNGTGGPGSIGFEAQNRPPGAIGELFSTFAQNC